MHFVIITNSIPPTVCGIGGHTELFARTLRLRGHRVTVLAGQGETALDHHIAESFWVKSNREQLLQTLEMINPNHVILQYTPLMYSRANLDIVSFWRYCYERWTTSLILHETYFSAWWHPPSLLMGQIEKRFMQLMVRLSHYVFTASELLLEEVSQWKGSGQARWLPIGSNLAVAVSDQLAHRSHNGISSSVTVLTLFGGGLNLYKLAHYINNVDKALRNNHVAALWLFLGGVDSTNFNLKLPVICPGTVSATNLSQWLQISDMFLMPHICGVSAKRGTLMAAMQHGLPVVGTQGSMTDPLWRHIPGVQLYSMTSVSMFTDAVLKLCDDSSLRKSLGSQNRSTFNHRFTWERIIDSFLDEIA